MRLSDLSLGDWRAEDLIETALGEFDPRRAIGILHRALRYGRADIYAFKAYVDLGSNYVRLGNLTRALHYYDRAIALAEDAPYVRARRGLLHDARGDHAAALADFEAALASEHLRLDLEFWERVERRLRELQQRS